MAGPVAPYTVWKKLRNYNNYLLKFHKIFQSTYFEELIVQSFSSLLHLPYYDRDNEDLSIPHRVTWNGSRKSQTKAPGGPDGIARPHDFFIVIEATLKKGTIQWAQEFAPSLRHAEDLNKVLNVDPKNIFTVLVTQEIHRDTYLSVKNSNNTHQYKVILLEIEALSKVIETSYLAFTLRQIEIRELFINLLDRLSDSRNLANFSKDSQTYVAEWQKKVLKIEKETILALKSYETMVKIRRDHVGIGEILQRLGKNTFVRWYLARINEEIEHDTIRRSLLQESLACSNGRTHTGEYIISPVPFFDFKSRCERRRKTVEKANIT